MNILITGGAGFIGSHLAEKLSEEHSVHIVDNLQTGRAENIQNPKIGFHRMDIANIQMLRQLFKLFEFNMVIHCAASYKNPFNWAEDAMTNCVGTANLCELSREFGVKKLIYFQTSLCYGLNPSIIPIPINYPVNPAPNSYAVTKTAAEQLISLSKVPFISFRLANCYGPRSLTGAIPIFYKKLKLGEMAVISNTRRDFVYIDDLVSLVIRAVNGEGEKNYYHISTGEDFPIITIFDIMANLMGAHERFPFPNQILARVIDRKPDDAMTILLDPSQTERDFAGWKASTPLQEGLKKTIEWYEENEPEETYTHLRTD